MKDVQLTKPEQDLINELLISDEKEDITNPYSNHTVSVEPIGVALYDFIKGTEYVLEQRGCSQEELKMYETAKGLFVKLYPEEYMVLLD